MNKKFEVGAGVIALGLILAGCGAKKSSHSSKPAKSHSSAVKKSKAKTLSAMPKVFQQKYSGKAGKLNITETVKNKQLVYQKNRGNQKVSRGSIKISKVKKCGSRYSIIGSLKGKTIKFWLKPQAKGALRFDQKALHANFVGKPVSQMVGQTKSKNAKNNQKKSQMPGMSNRNAKKNSRAIKHANKGDQNQ